MFQEYYKLELPPFQLTPDHRFFFGSSVHSRAIAHLVYGLSQEEGFIIITGEVGAGKTTLVERLASEIDQASYVLARIVTTQVSGNDLFRLIAAAFGIDGSDKAALLRDFEAMLRNHRACGRRTLLVVDEVQNLDIPALEELRMLSNITDGGHALLQTILLGQPQFRRTLASPDLDQLRQRVLASYHLGPLNEEETRAYIEYRLKAAGWSGSNPSFEAGAFAAVYRHTGGVPRRINRLCSRVLLYGALEETSQISEPMVETTARELNDDLGAGTPVAVTPEPGQSLVLPAQPQVSMVFELLQRVQALEQVVARRERVFERLLDLLGSDIGLKR